MSTLFYGAMWFLLHPRLMAAIAVVTVGLGFVWNIDAKARYEQKHFDQAVIAAEKRDAATATNRRLDTIRKQVDAQQVRDAEAAKKREAEIAKLEAILLDERTTKKRVQITPPPFWDMRVVKELAK